MLRRPHAAVNVFAVAWLNSIPVNCGESPVPTPMLVLKVVPLSATGSVVPSPTIIALSAKTAIAVIAPVPEPRRIPPSVKVPAPVPPLGTVRSVPSVKPRA